VNVLESIMVVSRQAKNKYLWHGMSRLPEALGEIRSTRLDEDHTEGDDAATGHAGGHDGDRVHAVSELIAGATHTPASTPGSARPPTERRREKSLGALSKRFVQLFLLSETGVVPLHVAADKLVEGGKDASATEKSHKTKIRRLYDIANILQSLGLIQKMNMEDSEGERRPAFKWLFQVGASLQPANRPIVDSPVRPRPSSIASESPSSKRRRLMTNSLLPPSSSAPYAADLSVDSNVTPSMFPYAQHTPLGPVITTTVSSPPAVSYQRDQPLSTVLSEMRPSPARQQGLHSFYKSRKGMLKWPEPPEDLQGSLNERVLWNNYKALLSPCSRQSAVPASNHSIKSEPSMQPPAIRHGGSS